MAEGSDYGSARMGTIPSALGGTGTGWVDSARAQWSRIDPRWRTPVAVAVVLVVVWAGVAGSRRASPQQSVAVEESIPAATAAPAETIEVVVHAAGAVRSPGLYHLGRGARVADLIDAAGGAAADADLDRMNLAATVADGERIYVPRVGEPMAEPVSGGDTGAGPVNLNTATVNDLDELPGIGPSTAQAIVDFRTRHGPFTSVEQLLEVRGIGPAKLDALRDLVKV